MPKISVITPTIRSGGVDMVNKCLKRQTFKDFEWLIAAPQSLKEEITNAVESFIFIPDPSKKDDETYTLNRVWNECFRKANGELFVFIVDLLWFSPDTLEKLWYHFQTNPMACVTTVGDQYERVENGKPELKVWADPRKRTDFGAFYEVSPKEMELCLASIPREAIYNVGGVDEVFDKYAALSEKELCYRIDRLGFKFFIDQGIEYRALHHPRLTKDWDEKYFKGWNYYDECLRQIVNGQRLKLDFLNKKEYKDNVVLSEKEEPPA